MGDITEKPTVETPVSTADSTLTIGAAAPFPTDGDMAAAASVAAEAAAPDPVPTEADTAGAMPLPVEVTPLPPPDWLPGNWHVRKGHIVLVTTPSQIAEETEFAAIVVKVDAVGHTINAMAFHPMGKGMFMFTGLYFVDEAVSGENLPTWAWPPA